MNERDFAEFDRARREFNWQQNESLKRQWGGKVFDLLKTGHHPDDICRLLNIAYQLVQELQQEYEDKLQAWVTAGIREIESYLKEIADKETGQN